jgi:MFS family permease
MPFRPGKRAAIVGLWGAVGALAAALGPGAGGLLIETGGWRAAFLVNIPLVAGLIVLGRSLAHVPGGDADARLDLPGTVLVIIALGALTFGIVSVDASGWNGPSVLAGLAAGTGATAAYLVWARGRRHATIDLALFRDPAFAFATLAALVFGVSFSMLFLGYFLFLIEIWRYGEAATGLAVMAGPLIVIPVAILGGGLAARIGHRPLLLTGAAGFTTAQVILYLTVSETASALDLLAAASGRRRSFGGVAVAASLRRSCRAPVSGTLRRRWRRPQRDPPVRRRRWHRDHRGDGRPCCRRSR